MTFEQAIIVAGLGTLAVVGGLFGVIAFLKAETSMLTGSLTSNIASDEDLVPHPRLRRGPRPGRSGDVPPDRAVSAGPTAVGPASGAVPRKSAPSGTLSAR